MDILFLLNILNVLTEKLYNWVIFENTHKNNNLTEETSSWTFERGVLSHSCCSTVLDLFCHSFPFIDALNVFSW